MKERPILFSTQMVQAILEGRKTQTRRVINPQPIFDEESGYVFWGKCQMDIHRHALVELCPYGTKGDELWVRETWQYSDSIKEPYLYKQQYEPDYLSEFHSKAKWRPSIFMPREASRIQLRITNIRVERLQDITEEDAKAEGIEKIHVEIAPSPANDFGGDYTYAWKDYINTGEYAGWQGDAGCFRKAIDSFQSLWESINGSDESKNWKANPWVWVVEFERVSK